jgi:hypothetical protein
MIARRNVLSLILLLALLTSCGREQQKPEASVVEQEEPSSNEQRLYFDIEMEKMNGIAAGDKLSVSLDNGEEYPLIIESVRETIPGMTSIIANVGDRDTGQAALVYRDSTLVGTVDLYSEGTSFQVYFDSETGRHYLTPRSDADELEGGEPLTPPLRERGN